MKRLRDVGGVFVLAAMIFGPALLAAGQPPQSGQTAGQTTTQATSQTKPAGGFSDLIDALKAMPGCLGVETARTSSGKQVIFAWFENKKAALTWYYSDAHQAAKKMFGPGSGGRTPMADVPDDDNPVLAIASLTPSQGAPAGGMPFAVSQISIELYRPLPGGVAAGGRFGPAAMKVPGLVDVPMPAPPKGQP